MEVLLWSLVIIVARIGDVSISTVRTILMIQGRRQLAIALAVPEILIWVYVVSRVVVSIQEQPLFGIAYAIGFATGTYVGLTIESQLALGRQALRIITRRGPELAQELRNGGLRVTQFDGYGRDGPVQELFIEVPRKRAKEILKQAREFDPQCYYAVEDVRMTSFASSSPAER